MSWKGLQKTHLKSDEKGRRQVTWKDMKDRINK